MQNERHQEESGGPNASEDSLEESIKRVERLGKELEEGEEEVSDQEETEVKRYNISVEDAKRRVAENKDYLSSIANTPFSNALPQSHLERHQAYLLFGGGYLHSFKRLETVLLGMTCFPFSVIDAIIHFLHNLFKRKPVKRAPGAKIEFQPLLSATPVYGDYDLPKHIPGPHMYVSHVLVHEAVTKLIMELEGCDYLTATGIGMDMDTPTRTPYGQSWQELVDEKQRRVQENKANKRKQKQPRKIFKKSKV